MSDRTDPLDGIEPPPLCDQIAPYRGFGDAELAVTLLTFQKINGTPGYSAPADVGATHHCQHCETDVRGVSRPNGKIVACPLCGESPGMLTLGTGPEGTDP